MREAEIQAAIRKALGTIPGLALWRNNVGLTGHDPKCQSCGYVLEECPRCHTRFDEDNGPRIRYGLAKGSADLVGLDYSSKGRFIGLEVKTPAGKASPEQLMWLDLVRRRGGFATIVRSPEEALAAVERARQGLSE